MYTNFTSLFMRSQTYLLIKTELVKISIVAEMINNNFILIKIRIYKILSFNINYY